MRRLYAFLLLLVGVGVISSEVAKAQTYAITDYVVRKVDVPDPQGFGSGNNWVQLTAGTAVTSGQLPYYAGYPYYSGYGIQMPFNFRYIDKQLTTTNYFTITCD